MDGRTAYAIEAEQGVEVFLGDLRSALKDRSFRPLPVRERMIPKANGKLRRLGIATVTDRVVQASVKLVIEPIFEADFLPCSYGFRPKRRAHDAVAEVRHFTARSYEWVVEGDIEACFDEISHSGLMDRVRNRIGDKSVLALVKAFLKAGILTRDGVVRETGTGAPLASAAHGNTEAAMGCGSPLPSSRCRPTMPAGIPTAPTRANPYPPAPEPDKHPIRTPISSLAILSGEDIFLRGSFLLACLRKGGGVTFNSVFTEAVVTVMRLVGRGAPAATSRGWRPLHPPLRPKSWLTQSRIGADLFMSGDRLCYGYAAAHPPTGDTSPGERFGSPVGSGHTEGAVR